MNQVRSNSTFSNIVSPSYCNQARAQAVRVGVRQNRTKVPDQTTRLLLGIIIVVILIIIYGSKVTDRTTRLLLAVLILFVLAELPQVASIS